MAAKKETPQVERTYTIPLRKEFQKVPRWKKTKKAIAGTKKFLVRHMKTEQVKLSKEINEELWSRGIKNPPHKIKVTVTKDDKGIARAELFGVKKKEEKDEKKSKKKEVKKEDKKTEEPKAESKPEVKEEKKAENVKGLKEEIKEQEEQVKGEELEGKTSKEQIKKEKEFIKEEKEEVKELREKKE